MSDSIHDAIQDATDAAALCLCGHPADRHHHLDECKFEDCWCPVFRPADEEDA